MTTGPPSDDRYLGGGSWSYRADGEEPDPGGLDPLSRRLLQAAGVLSVILIGLIAYSWATGGEDTNFNPIARAAERVEHSPGSRIAITGSAESTAGTVSMSGSGVYNARTGRTSMRMSVSVPGDGAIEVEGIGDGERSYTHSSLFSTKMPAGKEWFEVEAAYGGSQESEFGGDDLHQQLRMLQAVSDDVEDLGETQIDGVSATAYRGTVDSDRYAAQRRREGDEGGAEQIEKVAALNAGADSVVTVWLDEDELLRAMRLELPIPQLAGNPGFNLELTIQFSDFGIRPKVRLPAPGRVLDITPEARAVLGLLDGSRVHLPSPPASAPALGVAEYRRRANDVCGELREEGHRRSAGARQVAEEIGEMARRSGRSAALQALPAYYLEYIEPELRWAERSLGRFTRIPPPPQLQSAIGRYNHITALQVETLTATTRAGELSSPLLVKRFEREGHALERRANRLADSIGLTECGKPA